jgi:uncharacterized protein (DUF697 family)
MWRRIFNAALNAGLAPEATESVAEQVREQATVVWLLGKVQSGKTSIVRSVTRDAAAEVGQGFKPCTRFSRIYDFPQDMPIVRFLDTRGLGEVDYDPAEDLAWLERHAHMVVAVARAMDPQQDEILEVLRALRKRQPDKPLLLVQTRLHDGYPDDRDHPPYGELPNAPGLEDLHRSLRVQAEQFRQLPGKGHFRAVAVDLTRPEEQFGVQDYGLDALLDALDEVAAASRATLLREALRAAGDARARKVHPRILAYSSAAGMSDLVPMMGFVTVPSIQGKMLHSLSAFYGVDWSRRRLREFAFSLGSGTALSIGARFSARQVAKLIPVYGQVAGAAAASVASAALTYALGRAAAYYLEQASLGRSDAEGVADAYRVSLKEAYAMFSREGRQADRNSRHDRTAEG